MFRVLLVGLVLVLAACEATPVKDAALVKTQSALNQAISLPLDMPVVYHVDKGTPKDGVNFFGKHEEALELVTSDMFVHAGKLATGSRFAYLMKFSHTARWDRTWGGWKADVGLEVLSRDGQTLYETRVQKQASGGGIYDFDAAYNALVGASKEAIIRFLNAQGADALNEMTAGFAGSADTTPNYEAMLGHFSPEISGTGFFIDTNGRVMSAAHVVDECFYVEVRHKGNARKGDVKTSSKVLDLVVIDTPFVSTRAVAINADTSPAALGKQVFVTGYPLAGVLSDYPSLTIGNVSSLGGLKGSRGIFQFSAPVQPGNSGGPIVDYSGNLVGVVSSSLNQAIMLRDRGATAQNVNFGVDLAVIGKFLEKNGVAYAARRSSANFEQASKEAVEYTNQVLCYR